jgi:molybdopterin-binding protein
MVFGSMNSVMAQLAEITSAQLAEEAQAIVRGTVKSQESKWNDEKNYIWTFVTFACSETIKGEDLKDQDIEIKIPGGVVGEIGQKSSDQVTFEEGEEAVVFLGKETYMEKEYFNVVAQVQGKFTVKEGKIQDKTVESFIQDVKQVMEQEKDDN